MAAPFTITSVSNYNANPPSDDGAQTAANRVQWSTQKTKLSDPIKTAFDSSETNTSTAFGKVVGGAGITTTGVNYTVTAADQGKIVKATAAAIIITTPDATVVGSPFVFSVLNNSTGDITLDGNGTQTVDGALTAIIPAGAGCMVNTDGSNWFTDGQNFNISQTVPQGRLTLTSGAPILQADVVGATTIYYTPHIGDRVPITTDAATFRMRIFSELSLTLSVNHLANTLYDIFLFDNSGTITIGTGPAWNNSTAGSSARGGGPGTTQLTRIHGLWTNAVSMSARNGATLYTVGASLGLYVGTFMTSSVAGQTNMQFSPAAASGGANNLLGLYNFFNRRPVKAVCRDNSVNWNVTSATITALNNSSGDRINYVDGLGEECVSGSLNIRIQTAAVSGALAKAGLCRNRTNSFDFDSIAVAPSASGQNVAVTPTGTWTPSLGFNFISGVSAGDGTNTSVFVGSSTETYITTILDM